MMKQISGTISMLLMVVCFITAKAKAGDVGDTNKSNSGIGTGLTNNTASLEDSDSEPTNEFLVLSSCSGVLVKFDTNGLIVRSELTFLPRIQLESLNDDDLRHLLKCKLGYMTLAYFDNKHYKPDNTSEQSDRYAEALTRIWNAGQSLQDKFQTRLRILNDMNEYNADIKSYQKCYQAYLDYTDKKAKKYDRLYTLPDLSAHNDMVARMEMSDPLNKLQASASQQMVIFGSRIEKCVAHLTSVGVNIPSIPKDTTQDTNDWSTAEIIPPFRCGAK